jgi:PKD repeat protein
MMTMSLSRIGARCAALVLLTVGAVNCGLDKQSAPALAGPSEFGLSLTVRAFPDTLVADGQSQSAIQVTARDASGNPASGVAVTLNAVADRILIPTLTQSVVVTDSTGTASAGLIAPDPPARQFSVDPVVTVSAVPVGADFANAAVRTVQVRVRAPEGTPPPLREDQPVAQFSMSPGRAVLGEDVLFDAQATTVGGSRCLSRCTYQWDFCDGTSGTGMVATHRYAFVSDGTFLVTLTATAEVGGVGVSQQELEVYAVTGLRAMWSVTPASPAAGATATFDGSASRTDQGTVISQYAWDFGDGTSASTSSPTIEHTFATPGRYAVTLTVTGGLTGIDQDRYTAIVVVR